MLTKERITAIEAIHWLHQNGVIDSPRYWVDELSNVKYLDKLFCKIAQKFSFS